MKEKRGRKTRSSENKRNNTESLIEEENANLKAEEHDAEHDDAEHESENSDSDKELLKIKTRREPKRSSRKTPRKSLGEISDFEESEEENERERKSAKKVKKNAADKDEINGEKTHTRKSQRRSGTRVNQKQNSEDEESEAAEDEMCIKVSQKSSKRKLLQRPSGKKSKDENNENNENKLEDSEKSSKGKKSDKRQKGKRQNEDEDSDEEANSEEYEVEKLIDIYFKRNGEREFLVRWKGYTSKDDTWEPEKHLNCKDLIDAFMEKCEKAKSLPMREMRTDRRRTERYVVNEGIGGRKLSARLKKKPRKTYYDVE